MTRAWRTVLLVLTAAAGLSAACAAQPDGVADTLPPVGEIRPVSSGADIVLPFRDYELSSAQLDIVERATTLMARACVQRFGLDWPLPRTEPTETTVVADANRYGIIDRAEVAQRGYHPPPEPPRAPDDTSPSLDAVAVYAGKGASVVGGRPVPEGGCVGEARRQLAQGAPAGLSGAEFADLDQQIFQRAQADSRVSAAMAAWRACMAASGYHYTDVWAANDDARWTTPQPAPGEIATATTDLDCRATSNLVPVWLAVETAYQRQAIARRSAEFDATAAKLRTMLENASRIVTAPISK
ncbi:hypothetical protein DMH04_51250 [Kibdelosporangium aridum]|uniref:PknH-like extracellular domain-containing protein n=1 Tax=Kibdelosporangium aridum TaxID=2030 RepID=A0A428YA12_KIBAR|nr:hypothetical protein [Kibdelosporangium aridum]RSM64466.1 hypothetical protein DMH04_51250 [Kibdelosporangium aridum]